MPSEIAIGVELHRRAAGGADALLDLRGERAQVEVARHRLDPGRGDADDRLGQRLVVVADALAGRRARRRAAGPSVRARQRCLRSKPLVLTARTLPTRLAAGAGGARRVGAARGGCAACGAGARAPTGSGARGRGGPARDRPGGPGRCMFAVGDQAPLVAGERHPLGEHVVGVRQPRAAVGPRLVGELDAVLVEQLAGSAAGRRRSACAGRSGRRTARRARSSPCARSRRPRQPPHTRMKPRSRYIAHSSSLTHERSSSRARCSARRSRPGS